MTWFKRQLGFLLAVGRRKVPRQDALPQNPHELRDIGLRDWSPGPERARRDAAPRLDGKDPYSW